MHWFAFSDDIVSLSSKQLKRQSTFDFPCVLFHPHTGINYSANEISPGIAAYFKRLMINANKEMCASLSRLSSNNRNMAVSEVTCASTHFKRRWTNIFSLLSLCLFRTHTHTSCASICLHCLTAACMMMMMWRYTCTLYYKTPSIAQLKIKHNNNLISYIFISN